MTTEPTTKADDEAFEAWRKAYRERFPVALGDPEREAVRAHIYQAGFVDADFCAAGRQSLAPPADREALVEAATKARDFLLYPDCPNEPFCDHCAMGRVLAAALEAASPHPQAVAGEPTDG